MGFTVSTPAFRRLWDLCALGEWPVVLRLGSAAFTNEEQRAEREKADAELDEQELVRGGRPEADAEALLHILRRPRYSTDARLWVDGSVRALAAAQGPDAAAAVHTVGRVRVRSLNPDELAWAVVGLLPDHPPGSGSPASIDRRVVDRAADVAGADTDRFEAELLARKVAPAVAARFAEVAATAVRRGQFGAAVLDRRGTRHYASEVVNFADTPNGRFRLRESGRPGDTRFTLAPVSRDRLAADVRSMLLRLDPS